MHWTKAILGLSLIALFSQNSFAQSQSAFPSLWYSRTVTSSALGDQGAASRDPMDALQYNPANLARIDRVTFSVFNNPMKMMAGWFGTGIPLTSLKLAMNLGNPGSLGIEYTNLGMGEFSVTTPEQPSVVQTVQMYERSIAGTYALPLGEEFAVGAQVRYAWMTNGLGRDNIDHLFFGAGLSYEPPSRRLHVGFSLVNFGTRIEYPPSQDALIPESYRVIHADPPPAQMHLGIRGVVIAQEFFDVDLALGAMKPFDKRDGPPEFAGRSAFSALFTHWDHFPNDMTGSVGLSFVWHPISLGGGISFIQEMDLGYFSTGPVEGLNSFFTHGAKIGLQARGVSLLLGYSGRWHNNRNDSYMNWKFPWEAFQLDLSSDLNLFGGDQRPVSGTGTPHNIILSGGYTYGLSVGKMKEMSVFAGGVGSFTYNVAASFPDASFWSLEADFYLNDNAALLSSMAYARMKQTFTSTWSGLGRDPSVDEHPLETVSLESGFRFHPIEAFHPFFVQASLGIIRLNPIEDSWPRYIYQTFDRLVVGSLFGIGDTGIVLVPRVGLRTLWLSEGASGNQLGGYNQVELGVNVGYRL